MKGVIRMFNEEELRLIVDHCVDIEEEYGSAKSKEKRLLNYQVALKANSLLSNKVSLDILEDDLKFSNLI